MERTKTPRVASRARLASVFFPMSYRSCHRRSLGPNAKLYSLVFSSSHVYSPTFVAPRARSRHLRSSALELKRHTGMLRILANVPRGETTPCFKHTVVLGPLDFRLSRVENERADERIPGRIRERSTARRSTMDIKEYPGSAISPLTCSNRQRG